MANVLTYGLAPKWGVKNDNVTILINSVSTTPNVSEYLTKGGGGQTIGWVGYDQWLDWSINAVLCGTGAELPKFASLYTPSSLDKQSGFFFGYTSGYNCSICKTVATTQTAGDAYQLTLNGTIYPYVKNGSEEVCLGNINTSVGTGNAVTVGTAITD